MKITVEKLGRLREATFDLSKDLIVFVGPNNTSKTYAAYLIYGLSAQELVPTDQMMADKGHVESLFGAQPWFDHFINHSAQTTLDSILDEKGNQLIRDLFASPSDLFRDARVRVALEEDGLTRMREQIMQERKWGDFFAADLVTWTLSHAFRKAAILPAERSAIQLFSRELLLSRSDVLERIRSRDARSMADLLKTAPRYPLPIRDTLKIAGDLATLRARTAPFADLAELIERQVIQGTIGISDEGQIRYTPEGSGTTLDIHLASSSVKSLSLLAFYLRHVLDKGDLLIMDEPELNLHPDNQRRVARLLARLARAGVQVIISTHSEYVIKELNNLIMLSKDLDGSLRAELNYDDAETLRPEQVGVYLFGTTQAEEVPVEDTGFAARTIDREINRMNNSSEMIYLRLFGDEER